VARVVTSSNSEAGSVSRRFALGSPILHTSTLYVVQVVVEVIRILTILICKYVSKHICRDLMAVR